MSPTTPCRPCRSRRNTVALRRRDQTRSTFLATRRWPPHEHERACLPRTAREWHGEHAPRGERDLTVVASGRRGDSSPLNRTSSRGPRRCRGSRPSDTALTCLELLATVGHTVKRAACREKPAVRPRRRPAPRAARSSRVKWLGGEARGDRFTFLRRDRRDDAGDRRGDPRVCDLRRGVLETGPRRLDLLRDDRGIAHDRVDVGLRESPRAE